MACGSAKKEFRRLAFLVLALSLAFALVSASAPCVSSLSVELGLALVSASAPCAAGQGAKADVADQDYRSAPEIFFSIRNSHNYYPRPDAAKAPTFNNGSFKPDGLCNADSSVLPRMSEGIISA